MLNSLHSWGRLRTSDHFASASWLSGMTGLHHQTRKKNFQYVNMWVWNGFIFMAGMWSRIFFIVFYTGRNWGAQKLNDYFKSHGWSNKELDPKLLNSLLLHWVSSVKEERKRFWQQQHSHCEKKACRDHIVQDGYMVMICPVNKSCSSTVEFIVPPGCQSMGHTFKSYLPFGVISMFLCIRVIYEWWEVLSHVDRPLVLLAVACGFTSYVIAEGGWNGRSLGE